MVIKIDVLWTTGAELYFVPSKEGQDRKIDYVGHSLPQPVHLLGCLLKPLLDHHVQVLLVVGMGDGDVFATWLQLCCLPVGQVGLEGLVDSSIESLWAEGRAMGPDILHDLGRVSIKSM